MMKVVLGVVVCISDKAGDWLVGVLHFRCRAWKAHILVVNHCALLPDDVNTQVMSNMPLGMNTLA